MCVKILGPKRPRKVVAWETVSLPKSTRESAGGEVLMSAQTSWQGELPDEDSGSEQRLHVHGCHDGIEVR